MTMRPDAATQRYGATKRRRRGAIHGAHVEAPRLPPMRTRVRSVRISTEIIRCCRRPSILIARPDASISRFANPAFCAARHVLMSASGKTATCAPARCYRVRMQCRSAQTRETCVMRLMRASAGDMCGAKPPTRQDCLRGAKKSVVRAAAARCATPTVCALRDTSVATKCRGQRGRYSSGPAAARSCSLRRTRA